MESHHDDWDLDFFGSECLQHLNAVQLGHIHVEEHQVGAFSAGQTQPFGSIAGCDVGITMGFEYVIYNEFYILDAVVDDEHLLASHLEFPPARPTQRRHGTSIRRYFTTPGSACTIERKA